MEMIVRDVNGAFLTAPRGVCSAQKIYGIMEIIEAKLKAVR